MRDFIDILETYKKIKALNTDIEEKAKETRKRKPKKIEKDPKLATKKPIIESPDYSAFTPLEQANGYTQAINPKESASSGLTKQYIPPSNRYDISLNTNNRIGLNSSKRQAEIEVLEEELPESWANYIYYGEEPTFGDHEIDYIDNYMDRHYYNNGWYVVSIGESTRFGYFRGKGTNLIPVVFHREG